MNRGIFYANTKEYLFNFCLRSESDFNRCSEEHKDDKSFIIIFTINSEETFEYKHWDL